ncbi:MAG: site-specific integrase [Planctomycetes bacterium]|nr:site-specific integrase [Planctomycetota bacterium]
MNTTRILTKDEIQTVLDDLQRRSRRSINSRMNAVIFRLATCTGLRAQEIAGLTLADVRAATGKPHLRVRKEIAKYRRARVVPLWWDRATLAEIVAWKEFRRNRDSANESDLFVSTRAKNRSGNRLHRTAIRKRFKTACRALGADRVSSLTVHDGRHTFVSVALLGRSLAEVQAAAGHANISTTNTYLHIAVKDDGAVGDLFA